MTTAPRPAERTAVDETAMWRRVGWRILPVVGVAYVVSYIDRANLGYVAQPLSRDLGLTAAQIGLAGGLFFIGYVLMEIPSNMALRRFGARKWITRILVTWGLVTAATALVDSATTLYLARILLGVAEAGLAAGILLYLTFWFPRRQRSWAMTTFFLMIPLSSIVGAPLAAALLTGGSRLLAVDGWRALFVIEGALTVLIGILVYVLLPDRPRAAGWLTPAEGDLIERTLATERDEAQRHGALSGLRQALTSGRVWALAGTFFAITFGLYPLAFFLPAMLTSLTGSASGTGQTESILISAIPSVIAIVAMLGWSRPANRLSAVTATVAPMVLGAVGLLLATFTSGVAFVVAVCLSVSGIYTALAQFWRIPPLGMTAAAAAAGIAAINSVSNLSGFVGPYLTGLLKDATGTYTLALLVIAAIMALGVVTLLTVGRRVERDAAP